MPPANDQQNRDLTLQPDTYLYLQNEGKGGVISVHRGPTVVNQTGQDQPIRFDAQKRTYIQCSLEQAVQVCPRASEGDYVILENPTKEGDFPSASMTPMKDLIPGRRVVIPGPWSSALYPGQVAVVVEGHRLRSNQYLLAIVYNGKEAEENWEKGTVAVAQTEETASAQKVEKKGLEKPHSFAVGTRIIIKGSEVSFYIPCTGVEVIRDETNGKYVRDAVTLEQLEYCCLVDENGKKAYERGPKVVFPAPTQVFEQDSKQRRKFRPIELNRINGLHLKVTADFEDDDITNPASEDGTRKKKKYKEGQELFITGKELQIYYPREELAIIEYGQGNKKHFSTAIPKGEGRYVIERETGVINLKEGPAMLLPDPRSQILVRRILSEADCALWYPGNEEALTYNRALEEAMGASPSGRSGLVSEGDWRKAQVKRGGANMQAFLAASNYIGGTEAIASSGDCYEAFSPEEVGEEGGATQITRGTRYTQPRQLSLNTKYDGVPRIQIWPGYAVLVVGASGERRVVEGPEVVLLQYDEKLGFMELSTGKPKSTDRLMKTAYLCVQNNQVSDIVSFESKDHVRGTVKVSLRVNFEADNEEDKLKWFGTDNYVKFLTDHIRSILAGTAKRYTIAEIKDRYIDLVRDAILGTKPSSQEGVSTPLRTSRPGLSFENGMKVTDVEVLELKLSDSKIAQLLDEAQTEVVQTNISLERARKDLEATVEREEINQRKLQATHETEQQKLVLQGELLNDQVTLALAQIDGELKKITQTRQKIEATESNSDLTYQRQLARTKSGEDQAIELEAARQALAMEELDAATQAAVKRFEAAKDGLYEVLVSLGRDEIAVKLQEACTIERFLSGDSVGSSISNILSVFPALQGFLEKGKGFSEARNRLKDTASVR